MKIAEAYVEVRGDMKRLRGDLQAARSSLRTWAGRTAMMLGGYFGARQMFSFLRSSLANYAEAQEITAKLGGALRGLGVDAQTALPDLIKFANAIQSQTTYNDEAVRSLMTLGVTMGRVTGEQLKEMTKAAIGWAEILGVDARTTMNMLARAMQGNMMLWSRYDSNIAKLATHQEKLNYLMRRGAEGFNIARERADSLGGAIKQLANTWEDAKEEIGRGFAEGFGRPGTGGQAFLQEIGKTGGEYGRGLGTLISKVIGAETPAERNQRLIQQRIQQLRRAAQKATKAGIEGAEDLARLADILEAEAKRKPRTTAADWVRRFLLPSAAIIGEAGKEAPLQTQGVNERIGRMIKLRPELGRFMGARMAPPSAPASLPEAATPGRFLPGGAFAGRPRTDEEIRDILLRIEANQQKPKGGLE